MTLPPPDSVLDYWSVKADPWTKWADTVAPLAARFNMHLIEEARIEPGMRVLDMASGAGEPVLMLPELVGPEGSVVATDVVPEMLSGLKRRKGADALQICAADMQALPFNDASFDRATCRFGIMFVPDPVAGLSQVARVLKAGGRASFMVWGPREDQTLFPVLAEAIDRVFGLAPDDHHYQIFRFGADGSLTDHFEQAGFINITERSIKFTPKAPTDRPFWRPQLDMSFGHIMSDKNEAERAAVDAEIRALLEPMQTEEGYQMKAHIRIASGDR